MLLLDILDEILPKKVNLENNTCLQVNIIYINIKYIQVNIKYKIFKHLMGQKGEKAFLVPDSNK